MGVFVSIFRRSRTTEDTQSAEAEATQPMADAAARTAIEAEDAADNEADEGART